MDSKYFQVFSTVKWEKVLSSKDDMNNLFKTLQFENMTNIEILSRTPLQDDRLTIMVAAEGENNEHFVIIIDATSGIPTWKQFIDVTYEQGCSADIKIILYGKDFEDSFYRPAGGLIEIENLVRRNNKCGITTYLAKGVTVDQNGQNILGPCSLESGPDDVDINEKQIFPTKRQVQEAEFWAGYYLPMWASDFIERDDNIITGWAPGYSLRKDLKTEATWDDQGFQISLVGEPGSEAIKWIWDNKKGDFESEYPECPVILRIDEGKPYAVSVIIDDLSMTDLINMEPKEKWYYGDKVFGEEHKFQDVAEGVVDDYIEMNKEVKAA